MIASNTVFCEQCGQGYARGSKHLAMVCLSRLRERQSKLRSELEAVEKHIADRELALATLK